MENYELAEDEVILLTTEVYYDDVEDKLLLTLTSKKIIIEKVEIKFEASVGRNGYMIGQISAKQIEQALKAKGLIVDKRKFVDFSPVTYFGHGKVKVELFKGVIAEINVYIVEKAK